MYEFKFADIGEGIHEGRILEWNYKVGDKAEEGETLVVIETDKVNAEIPLPVNGTIVKLGPAVGETVFVGDILAVIDNGGESSVETPNPDSEEAGVVGKIEVGEEVIEAQVTEVKQEIKSERVLATPVARKLASDLHIKIEEIPGTGDNGRVLRTDVERYSEQRKSPSTAFKPVVDIPKLKVSMEDRREKVTSLRRAVVKAMTLSKQIVPHTTLIDELDITELVSFRNFYKQKALEKGVKLTYMPFIIKALTKAIETYPIFNSSYDMEQEEIIYKGNINVGIAVDTPDGLIVPNIKNADRLTLFGLANEVERLATLAKERKIQLSDLQSGTISITNFGAFDAISGTPIIKYPEVAILGIGKISKKPIVKENEIVVGDILPLSLTFDHRIIDGADGGRFMMLFKKYLQDPMLILME